MALFGRKKEKGLVETLVSAGLYQEKRIDVAEAAIVAAEQRIAQATLSRLDAEDKSGALDVAIQALTEAGF
jgi:hypothetical protein